MENEENVEDDILLSTFVSKLRKKKLTPRTSKVQTEGHEDKEEKNIENLDNFSEPDIETFSGFEERGTETSAILEKWGIESPTVL